MHAVCPLPCARRDGGLFVPFANVKEVHLLCSSEGEVSACKLFPIRFSSVANLFQVPRYAAPEYKKFARRFKAWQDASGGDDFDDANSAAADLATAAKTYAGKIVRTVTVVLASVRGLEAPELLLATYQQQTEEFEGLHTVLGRVSDTLLEVSRTLSAMLAIMQGQAAAATATAPGGGGGGNGGAPARKSKGKGKDKSGGLGGAVGDGDEEEDDNDDDDNDTLPGDEESMEL